MILSIYTTILLTVILKLCSAGSVLDNGVIGKNLFAYQLYSFYLGDPTVECMEDRVRLTFHTERPFTGRIFVKGMVENDKCVNKYAFSNFYILI